MGTLISVDGDSRNNNGNLFKAFRAGKQSMYQIGIDEVGRGCWAGPLLVVAARGRAELPKDLKDSKLMNKYSREKILNLLSYSCEFGEGWVHAAEIDELGLANAMRQGVKRALADLQVEVNETIILDGKVNYCPEEFRQVTCQVSADRDVPIVSAASVYAKVARDNYMLKLSNTYPGYGFDKHVGYGTEFHKLMLEELGVLPGVHRYSYKPIRRMVVS